MLSQSPQNDIPAKLAAFRARHRLAGGASIDDARRAAPTGWTTLESELVGIVIGMPLAKLQRFGEGARAIEDRFIYDFGWRDEVSPATTGRSSFDDSLRLRPGVGAWLVRLAPLLRPLVETKWADLVARRNVAVVDQYQLAEFLFGASRISLDRVREPLREVQAGRCFYCRADLGTGGDVDHFVPWSRHPDNTVDNLVLAHAACNNAKSSSIAGHEHLRSWVERLDAPLLDDIADMWPRRRDRTLGAVRSTYLWLPVGTVLWRSRGCTSRSTPPSCATCSAPPETPLAAGNVTTVPQGFDVPMTLDADLHDLLQHALSPGDVVPTISRSVPNTIGEVSADGVDVMTKRSSPSYSLVPAWMLNAAWRILKQKGTVTSDDLRGVRRSSAVFAILARLPGVAVTSSTPIVLTANAQP